MAAAVGRNSPSAEKIRSRLKTRPDTSQRAHTQATLPAHAGVMPGLAVPHSHADAAAGRRQTLAQLPSLSWEQLWKPPTDALRTKHTQLVQAKVGADRTALHESDAAGMTRRAASAHLRSASAASTRSVSSGTSHSDASISVQNGFGSPMQPASHSFDSPSRSPSHLHSMCELAPEEDQLTAEATSTAERDAAWCVPGVGALLSDLTIDAQAQMHQHNSWTPFVNRRRKQMMQQQHRRDDAPAETSGGGRMDLAAITPRRRNTAAAPQSSPTLPSYACTPHVARHAGGSSPVCGFDDDLETVCAEDSPEFPFALPTQEECEAFFRNRPRSPARSPRKPIKLYDAETNTVMAHGDVASVTGRGQTQPHDSEPESFDFGSPISVPPVAHAFNTPAPFAAPCSPMDFAGPSSRIELAADALFALTPAPADRPTRLAMQLAAPSFGSAMKTPRSAAAGSAPSLSTLKTPQSTSRLAPRSRPTPESSSLFAASLASPGFGLSPLPKFGKHGSSIPPSPCAGLTLSLSPTSTQQQQALDAISAGAAPPSSKRLVRFDVPASLSSSMQSSPSMSFASAHSSVSSASGGFSLDSMQEHSQFDATALQHSCTVAAGTAFQFEQPATFHAGSKEQPLHSSMADRSLMRSLVTLDSFHHSHSSLSASDSLSHAAPFAIVVDPPVSAVPSSASHLFPESSYHSSSSSSADDLSFSDAATGVRSSAVASATFLRVPGRQRPSVGAAPAGGHRVPIKRQRTQSARAARFTGARFHRKQRIASTGAKVCSLRIFPSRKSHADTPGGPDAHALLPSPVAVNRTLDFSSIDADADADAGAPLMRHWPMDPPRPTLALPSAAAIRAPPPLSSGWLTTDEAAALDAFPATNLSDTFEQIALTTDTRAHMRHGATGTVHARVTPASASVPVCGCSRVCPVRPVSGGSLLPFDLGSVSARHGPVAAARPQYACTAHTIHAQQPQHTTTANSTGLKREPAAAPSVLPSGLPAVSFLPSSFVPFPSSSQLWIRPEGPTSFAAHALSDEFVPVAVQLYYRVEARNQTNRQETTPPEPQHRRHTEAPVAKSFYFGDAADLSPPAQRRWSPLAVSPYPSPSLAAAKQRFCEALAAY